MIKKNDLHSNRITPEIEDFLVANKVTLDECEQVLKILGITNISTSDLPDFIKQLKEQVKGIVPKSEKEVRYNRGRLKTKITMLKGDLDRYKLFCDERKYEYDDANAQFESVKKRKLEISYNKAQRRVDETNEKLLKLSSALSISQTNAGVE